MQNENLWLQETHQGREPFVNYFFHFPCLAGLKLFRHKDSLASVCLSPKPCRCPHFSIQHRQAHLHTHTPIHVCAFTYTLTCTCTCAHTLAGTYACLHEDTLAISHTHPCPCTPSCTLTLACTLMCTLSCAHLHTCIL